jgi:hypothetical protein
MSLLLGRLLLLPLVLLPLLAHAAASAAAGVGHPGSSAPAAAGPLGAQTAGPRSAAWPSTLQARQPAGSGRGGCDQHAQSGVFCLFTLPSCAHCNSAGAVASGSKHHPPAASCSSRGAPLTACKVGPAGDPVWGGEQPVEAEAQQAQHGVHAAAALQQGQQKRISMGGTARMLATGQGLHPPTMPPYHSSFLRSWRSFRSSPPAPAPAPAPAHLNHPLGVLPDGSPVLPAHGSTQEQAVPRARHHPCKEEQEVAQVGSACAIVDVPAAGGNQAGRAGRRGRHASGKWRNGWTVWQKEQAMWVANKLYQHLRHAPTHPPTHPPAVVVELAHAGAAGAAVVRLRRLVVAAVLAVAAAVQRTLAHPAASVQRAPLQVALHGAGWPHDAGRIVAAPAAAAAGGRRHSGGECAGQARQLGRGAAKTSAGSFATGNHRGWT